MKITTDYLLSLEACKSGIDAFNDLFPGGAAELNSDNISKARCGGLGIIWLIERIDDQDTLAKLSKDDSGWVRAAVARNRNTPPATLTTLSKDDDYLVRDGVSLNPNTPPATLAKLSKDESEWVRRRVVENPTYKGARCERQAATRKRDEEVER